ncbi:hypothetical protein BDY21DRAFT_413422 [Lineolata rhizophorae]|uniref:Autophagy-related protein 29 n=1 Tax=Lineolata rhizophorae TaxID=578093 RepID=A0A6A6PAG6_9PEZI|nr:hypothetical protein BDY21DRAFT_413422 [Lineolata rhizophorae]
MSPPTTQGQSAQPKGSHGRNPSGNVPRGDMRPTKRQAPVEPDVHYTMLIRLPFARGDFIDPPPVEWDANKDKQLWKIISRSPKTSDLDWDELSAKFQVSPAFMLQQAAWLYQRHLSHVRAQMRKVGSSATPNTGAGGSNPSPTPGGIPMKRLGSGGASHSRAPSALSVRTRDSPKPEGSLPGTPRPSGPSRTPSTNTVTQSRQGLPPTSPRGALHRSFRSSFPAPREPTKGATPAAAHNTESPREEDVSSPSPPPVSSSSESESDRDEEAAPANIRRSQIFKRPPRFAKPKPGLGRLGESPEDDGEDASDEDGDSSPTFLPFAQPPRQDPSATVRDPGTATTSPGVGPNAPKSAVAQGKMPAVDSSASSASSAAAMVHHADAPAAVAAGRPPHQQQRPPGPLSPRHRAELARLSPRRRGGKGDGSEGTPSMGSSFSDLDDTSVTQSALEEALLSNMQHGGSMAGRMSSLSQALRSRYL